MKNIFIFFFLLLNVFVKISHADSAIVDLYNSGEYKLAIKEQESILEIEKIDFSTVKLHEVFYLLDSYLKIANEDSAKQIINQILSAQNNKLITLNAEQQVYLWSSLGVIYRNNRQFYEAEKILKKSISFASETVTPDLKLLLAGLYNELGLTYAKQNIPSKLQYKFSLKKNKIRKKYRDIVVINVVNKELNIEIFNEHGHSVCNIWESELPDQAGDYLDLKKQLKTLNDINNISAMEQSLIIKKVLLITGRTAESNFEKSLALVSDDNSLLRATVLLNLARLTINRFQLEAIDQRLLNAAVSVSSLSDSQDKAQMLLSLADLYRHVLEQKIYIEFDNKERGLHASYISKAFEYYTSVVLVAKKNDDFELISYANGSIGLLYENENRIQEAEYYARKAIFHAQSVDALHSLYQWQWLLARIQKSKGDILRSGESYDQAMFAFKQIMPTLISKDKNAYQDIIKPFFYQYAELQFQKISLLKDKKEKEDVLYSVRNALETIKQKSEISNYFGNQCKLPASNLESLDRSDKNTAILYTISLPNQVALLVTSQNQIQYFSSPVNNVELKDTVRRFRKQIQMDWGTKTYKKLAQKLYDWLILPIAPLLNAHSIETLVVVADSSLRTIPFGALHNGNEYLISKYSIANTLGLLLMESQSLDKMPIKAYAGGLSDPVQGYSALPQVTYELEKIQDRTKAIVYENEHFTKQSIEEQLVTGDYNIAHIATHGRIDSDYQQSFFLTYDTKYSLTQLGESSFQRLVDGGKPIELLVLSACETAVGDDQSALGLAGAALQAGVRSVIASLWSIDDQSSAVLMDEFYSELVKQKGSKANSLRKAQLSMINDPRFKHPSHWAAYLLIGNWL